MQQNEPSNGPSVSASETLLQDAVRLVSNSSGALQKVLQLHLQDSRQPVRAEIPWYRGYGDPASVSSFLEALCDYARASGLSEQEVL